VTHNGGTNNSALQITIISFGYKEGTPPLANLVFDVRFLKNPFWVEELKPLTGLDQPVQDYVLHQPLAIDFLRSVMQMLDTLLPKLEEQNISDFTIAFGCTGGQHRSATLVEALAAELHKRHPLYAITKSHRELNGRDLAAVKIKPASKAKQKIKAED
jgi:RNase adapter protein RapZ